MTPTAHQRTFVLVVSAVVVLVVLAAAWGGTWEVQDRDIGVSWLDGFQLPTIDREPAELPAPEERVEEGDGAITWLGPAVAIAIGLVALALVLAVVVRLLQQLWGWYRYREAPRSLPEPVGGLGLDGDAPQLPILRRGVAEAQRHLEQIDRPVDAVVAAWLALEEAAASSGVGRLPAQTPTEFTVAVLDRTAADPDATAELLALYHRARFSLLPITPDDVVTASRCLGRLAASWDAVPVVGPVTS